MDYKYTDTALEGDISNGGGEGLREAGEGSFEGVYNDDHPMDGTSQTENADYTGEQNISDPVDQVLYIIDEENGRRERENEAFDAEEHIFPLIRFRPMDDKTEKQQIEHVHHHMD